MTIQIFTRVLRSYEEGPKDIILYESESASEAIQWAIDNEDEKKDGDYIRIRHKPLSPSSKES